MPLQISDFTSWNHEIAEKGCRGTYLFQIFLKFRTLSEGTPRLGPHEHAPHPRRLLLAGRLDTHQQLTGANAPSEGRRSRSTGDRRPGRRRRRRRRPHEAKSDHSRGGGHRLWWVRAAVRARGWVRASGGWRGGPCRPCGRVCGRGGPPSSCSALTCCWVRGYVAVCSSSGTAAPAAY